MKRLLNSFSMLILLALGVALAAGAPAGTDVTNQAFATYQTPAGQILTSESQEVTFTVLPVYSFIITPDGTEADPGQTEAAVPGEDVTFVYTVTNQGNITDTIALAPVQSDTDGFELENVRFYHDLDNSGTLTSGDLEITSAEDLAPDESRQILVVGTVPAGVAEDEVANINLVGTSSGAPENSDANNWAQAVAGAGPVRITGVNLGNGDTDPNSPPSDTPEDFPTPAGAPVSFPIELTNTGEALDSFELTTPDLPTGWTAEIFTDADCNGEADSPTPLTNTGELDPAQNICFVVTVTPPVGVAPGSTPITITATSDNDPAVADSITNTVTVPGDEVAGVNIGNGDGNPDTSPSDTPLSFPATPGTPVSYPIELTNTGSTEDTFDLNVPGLPTGWTAQIFPDADCDGLADSATPVADTGALAPAGNACFVVTVTPPADATPGSTPVAVTATIRNDPGVTDSITNTVTLAGEEGAGVNIGTGDGDPGTVPGDLGTDVPAEPGTPVSYPVELTNTGSALDTFALNIPDLPAGWTAEVFTDADCDGVPDNASPLSSVGPLDPAQNVCLVVTVTPPADAAPGDTPITVTATSGNDPTVSDSIETTIVIGEAAQPGVNIGNGDANPATAPSDAVVTLPATPGTPLSYPLEVTNTGDAPDTFTLTLPNVPTGWTAQIFPDADCDGEADGAAVTATGELGAGENACFVVTVTPAADAGPGATPITVTATSGNDPTISDSITNTVVIGDEEDTAGVNLGNGDENPATGPSDTPITFTTAPGVPLSYPLELTNTGTATDTFDLTPSVPTGWSAQIFPDANCDGEAGTGTPVSSAGPLEPGENACFVVNVTPPVDAAPGSTPVTITATSQNDPAVSDILTNTVTVEGDEPAPGVEIGNGDENTGTPPSGTGITIPATPGAPVSYPIELTNTGNAPDSFELAIPGVPTGWTAEIFPDADCDGEADSPALTNTGSLEPAQNVCFVVTVTPPAGAAPGSTPITITATSDNDPAVADSITNTVVIEGDGGDAGVNIGNGDENTGTAPSDVGVTFPATPGVPLSYPLELTNTGDETDTFALTLPNVPVGWEAEIFPDADCDGVADSSTPTGSAGPLEPGENICLVVIATPPADAGAGSTPITVTATSGNDPAVSDSITNTLTVQGGDEDEAGVDIGNGDENPATAPSDSSVNVPATPGTPASYPLELTNTGDAPDTFELTLPNLPAGWTAQIFPDADCDGAADSGSPITSVGPLDPAENVCLVVTVTPPADAAPGNTPITVTATSGNDPAVSDSITNTVVIEGGEDAAGVNIGNGDEDVGTDPSDTSRTVPAVAGTPVSYPLELTNTGDTTDSFGLSLPNVPAGWTAQVFADANCDGVADSTPLSSVGPLAPGENVCLVVTVTPPAGANPGSTPITVTATSTNDPSVSDSITNTIVIEDNGGGGEENPGVNIGNGDENPNTGPSDAGKAFVATPGTPLGYPLELTNTGNTTDTFELTLPSLPSGWTAQLLPDTDCDGVADGTSPIASVGPLAPGENVCFVVTVTPPVGAAPGSTPITVTATSGNDPTVSDSITNTVVIAGGGGGETEAGVNIGNGDEDSNSPPSDSGKTLTAKPGTPVSYPLEVTNTGDTADTFTLTVPNLPSGWTAQLLPDANCDGTADSESPITSVGPLEPGENACFIVSVTPPAGTAPGNTPITVTATSGNDPALSDSVTNTVVIERGGGGGGEDGAGVNIGNGDRNAGTGPDDTGRTIPAQPGEPVSYPLELTNTGNAPDTFTLTLPNVPTGWTAQLFPDANCDGTADSGTPITSVGPLDPGENVCFVVTVTPAAGTQPGSTPITVVATSRNDPSVSDSITNTLVITGGGGGGGGDEPGVNVGNGDRNPDTAPSDSGQTVPAKPGTPVSYPVELTNTGSAPDTFTLTIPGLPEGWTAQIFPDTNCDGVEDGSSPITSVGPLDPGENVCFVVSVTPPADAGAGSTPITVTATSGNDPSVSDSITNTVVIERDGGGGGGEENTPEIVLTKSVTPGGAVAVGDTLSYTVTASNVGDASASNTKIYDLLPGGTAFVSASASTTLSGDVLYSVGGSSWSSTAPASLEAGSSLYVGVDTNGDATIGEADSFAVSGSLTLTLSVRVTGGDSVSNAAQASYSGKSATSNTVSSPVGSDPTEPPTPSVCDVLVTPDGSVAAPAYAQTVAAGSVVYLPYTLTNLGDAGSDFELRSLVLDESTLAPTGTRVLLDSNANGAFDVGETAAETLGGLGADETVALLLELTLGADPGVTYVNLSARCLGDTNDSTLDADNIAKITVTAGSLSVPVKTAEPAAGTPLYAGAAVSYTISFTAEGGAQQNVVVEDIIDDDLELPTSYTSGIVTDPATGLTTEAVASLSGRTLTWTFVEVPAGMNVNLNVAAVVRSDVVPPATIDNIACVSASTGAPLCSAPVTHTLAPVELELTKTAMSERVAIGERLTFELVATNPSAVVPLLGGRLTDALPEGLEYLPGSAVRLTETGAEEAFEPTQTGNTLVWTLPDLAPGASLTIRFDTRVTTAAIGHDELRNAAELEGIGFDGGVVADDEDDAVVEIDDTLFRSRSVLLGHAYTDEDDSGDFSDGDEPVENVRLYLSSGISVVTDEFGRYTVTDLPSGLLALRLDRTTTGELESLTTPTATHEGLWRVRLLPGLITRQDVPFEPLPEKDAAIAEATGSDTVTEAQPEAQRDPNLPASPVETLTGVNLLAPADGEVVRGRSSVPIIIEAPLGDEVVLTVNGQTIPASLLGTQVLDEARGRQRLEYVGVRLTEGDNDLVVTSTPVGAAPTVVQSRAALAGRPATVVITPDGPLAADSAQPLAFTLRVEDENGNPPADMYVTLEADGATFASEDANRKAGGMQVETEGGEASFTLEPLPQPAPIEILAKLQGLEAKTEFAVLSAERPWVGAAAGSVGASYAPGEALEFGVSGTLFARGSLLGGLLTVGGRYPEAVYGEPSDPFTLLPDDEIVDPELVTGSSGSTRREARSEDGAYFRFEDNLSFVQYGDFATDLLGPLLGGGRELTGLSGRYANFGGGLDVRGYASYQPQGDEVTGRDVPSNGTSLYLLPSDIDSLRVSAVSKDDAGVVVSQDDLSAGLDYRFTSQTGQLLLSSPLSLQDELGNRNFLRLSYRFPAGVGAPRVLEAGAQVAYDAGAFAPRVGVAQSQNGASTVRALSAGVSYDDDNGLKGSADLAYGGDDLSSGLAATAEATYDGKTLDGSASYNYVSPDYTSPDLAATTDVGQDVRFGVSYDVSDVLNLSANTQASQTPTTGDAWSLSADTLASYRPGKANTELQGGLEYDDGSVRALAGVKFREPLGLKRAEVSVLHRQGVTAASTSETDFGVSYALLENLSLTLTERLEWGTESNLLVGLETGFDNTDIFGGSGYAGRTTFSTQYELPGGVSAQEGRARLGLSTVYPVSDAFSVDGSLEQILDFTGEETDQTVGTAGVNYDTDDLDAEGRAQLSFGDGALKGVYSAGSNFRLSDNLFGGVNALYSSDTASETPQGFSFNVAGAYRSLALDVLTSHTVRLGSLAPETGNELSGEVRAALPFGVLFDLRGSYLYRSEGDLGLIDMSALGASVYPWNGGSVTLYGQLFHLWLENEFVGGASLELSQEVICGLYAVGGYNYGGLSDPLGPGYGGEGFFVRLDLIMDEQFLCEGLAE